MDDIIVIVLIVTAMVSAGIIGYFVAKVRKSVDEVYSKNLDLLTDMDDLSGILVELSQQISDLSNILYEISEDICEEDLEEDSSADEGVENSGYAVETNTGYAVETNTGYVEHI